MTINQTIETQNSSFTSSGVEYAVYEHGTYERGSVLEGQDKRSFKDSFDTLEEAQAAYPKAQAIAGTTKQNIDAMTSHLYDGTCGDYGDPNEHDW